VPNSKNQLRLNVGFLINAPVGDSRDFQFDIPHIHFEPDLDLNNLSGTAKITRTAQGLLVQTKMRATLPAECVRCLQDFIQQLNAQFTELYAFSRNSVTESGLLLPDDAHIDLSPLVREYMLLEIPISPTCSPDCQGLCPVCGANLNETPHNHDDESIDSRMSVLKSLLDKNKK
jgi:uncharacterized protein